VQDPFIVKGPAVTVEKTLNSIQEILIKGAPYAGVALKNCPLPTRTVCWQVELAPGSPGVLFGVPVPVIVMASPLRTVIAEVHCELPPEHAGIMIVSPFTAVCVGPLMTAFTSE
jgi:hypothetical protein